jgi:hypothetical protein
VLRHHPVVLEQQAQRAADVQLRIADWITGFAGLNEFRLHSHRAIHRLDAVYRVQAVADADANRVLEAIFLSTFVMIGQNRQAAFQQAKAIMTSPNRNWSSKPTRS